MMIVRTKFRKKAVIICGSVDEAKVLATQLDEQLKNNEDYQNNNILVDREKETVRIYFYEDMAGEIPQLVV